MASTAHLIEWLAAGAITTAGVPIASGKVRFYRPDTLTPVTVYADAAQASPITQPITLSAGGHAIVYTADMVRMIVKDASDSSALFDVAEDIIRGEQVYLPVGTMTSSAQTVQATIASWAGSGGGSVGFWQYKRSGNSVERNIKEAIGEIQISVKDRGALGDGINDDTLAIQAAITEIAAAGGGNVFVPPGTYLTSAAITLSANVSLRGAGPGASIIKLNNATANAILVSAAGNNAIEHLKVTHATATTGIAISCASTTNISIRNIFVVPVYKTAIKVDACNTTSIYDSTLSCSANAGAGRVVLYSTSGVGHALVNCSLSATGTDTAIECDTGTSGILLSGNNFVQALRGVLISSSSNDDLIRLIGSRGLANNVSIPLADSGAAANNFIQIGNDIEGSASGSAITSGATFTPSPILLGPYAKATGTTTGSAYIVAAPANAPNYPGFKMTIQFFNNAGGAVTGWTLNAIYKVASAISTTNLDKTTITFCFDGVNWREAGRAVTT